MATAKKNATKATKAPTKAKASKATKTTARKAATKAKSANVDVSGDDARKVARYSDGDLSTGQVRVLRFLSGRKNPATMAELKDGVGIGAENKYSAQWLAGVHELRDYDYIAVEAHEGSRGLYYSIRPDGKKALDTATKAYAKAE